MNIPASSPLPRPHPRYRRFLLAVLIFFTVLFVAHLCWYAYAVSDLKAAREEAAQAGLITDPAKIYPAPCPDADNAALKYQAAYGLLTLRGSPYAPGREGGKLDDRLAELWPLATSDRWEKANPALREKARLALMDDDFAQAWQLIAAGARQQRCVFPVDYSAGAAARIPHVEMLRKMTGLGCIRARILAEDGHIQQAADLIIDLLRMHQQQLEFTNFFHFLVGYHIRKTVLGTLRSLIAENLLPGADLSRTITTLNDPDSLLGLARCIDVEVGLVGNWVFRQADQGAVFLDDIEIDGKKQFDLLSLIYGSWLATPLRRGDEAAYLRLMATIRQRVQIGTPFPSKTNSYLHPYTTRLGYDQLMNINVTSWQKSARLRQAAQAAIDAHAGRTPIATPGISVTRTEDGWTIVPEVLPSEQGQKWNVPEPWFIPVKRTP